MIDTHVLNSGADVVFEVRWKRFEQAGKSNPFGRGIRPNPDRAIAAPRQIGPIDRDRAGMY
jgi:hypothetical protein